MDSSRDGIGSINSRTVENETWREILDVTETLATKYREQHNSDLEDDGSERSISDDTIKEVNDAIAKFREHAARLGVDERRLMAAVRDDDKSLQSMTGNDSLTSGESPRTISRRGTTCTTL